MPTQSKTIKFPAIAKLGKKGQITVPKQFREDLGIGIGARVDVLRVGDGLVILPERGGVAKRRGLGGRSKMAQRTDGNLKVAAT